MRDSQIYISHDLRHLLKLIARSRNDLDRETHTADEVAEQLLSEAVNAKWPHLYDYLAHRRKTAEEAEAEAVAKLKGTV